MANDGVVSGMLLPGRDMEYVGNNQMPKLTFELSTTQHRGSERIEDIPVAITMYNQAAEYWNQNLVEGAFYESSVYFKTRKYQVNGKTYRDTMVCPRDFYRVA